jgi:Skp family chaperone for outer membrane proteins
MQKVNFPILLLLLLSACDNISINAKGQIKWAMVDAQKITKALTENFIKNNPYPKELGDENELNSDLSHIQKQISQLEDSARQKCLNDISSNNKESKSKESIPKPSSSSEQGVIHINGHDVPMAAFPNGRSITFEELGVDKYPNTNPQIYSSGYKQCVANISKDSLIVDLRGQVEKIYETQTKRRRHEGDVRKKVEDYAKTIIAKYAEKNKFQMIISSNYGDNAILYNVDKVTLNVTDDVISFLSKINTNKEDVSNSNNAQK